MTCKCSKCPDRGTEACSKRVDPKVELLKIVNGRVRKMEVAHRATKGSKMTFK